MGTTPPSPSVPPISGVRTLLVDDHALVRAGLRTLLESIEGVTVMNDPWTFLDVTVQ